MTIAGANPGQADEGPGTQTGQCGFDPRTSA